jgi:hypothetical protein
LNGDLARRATAVIRGLLTSSLLADYVVNPGKGPDTIVATDVVTQLEAVATPADTGEQIASMAGGYADFSLDNLETLAGVVLTDDRGELEVLCGNIRRMSASLLRQNER